MDDNGTTKVDLSGGLDTTLSSNPLSPIKLQQDMKTGHLDPVQVKAIPSDPVKPTSCLPPGRQRLMLIVTLVALAAVLAGGVFAAVFIFEFNVYAPQVVFEDDALYQDYPEKADDDSVYETSSIHPEEFLFMVDQKAAGTKAGETLRLVNGASPSEGRLEVFYNGEWGTVCDDYFNIDAAHVVCRQLGFPSADHYYPNAFFGAGSDRIWLDNVRCTGQESDIDYCPHRNWGWHNCYHSEDVGVACTDLGPVDPVEARLVGGSSANEGRVEVMYNGQWGTVCDDSWTNEDAQVICRQLRLPYEDAVAVSEAFFGQGSGAILLDEVRCAGNEENIAGCLHQAWGIHDCRHSEDAGVICTDGADPFAVRLVGGSIPNEGRVEVRYNGMWGTVCDDYWGVADANVVCRQLGYTGTGHRGVSDAAFGEGNGNILMDDVACSGSEGSLEDCVFRGWYLHDCEHSEDASVICATGEDSTDVRLVGGSNTNEGRVEIRYNGIWGTICDDSWDDTDAAVVCKQLGLPYGGAVGVGNGRFGQGSGQIWLDDVNCAGSESTVGDCQHRPWGSHNCQHNEDAGVMCQDAASDQTPPVITSCPANQPTSGVIYALSGQTTTYNFPDATATDVNDLGQSTNPTISYTIQTANQQTSQQSSGLFPIGTTSVTVTATDDSGNQASCIFTVTVTESTGEDSTEVRLVGGSNTNEGRVEIRYNGIWGTICDDSWDNTDAAVVCKQLGLPYGGAVGVGNGQFGQGSGQIWLDDVNCAGSESSVGDCEHRPWGIHNCQHNEDAGVMCQDGEDSTEVRLVGGSNTNEGRVEIRYNGIWGTICDDSWDNTDAAVVCKQLGLPYGGAVGVGNSQFGQGSGQIWLDDVNCAGSESRVGDCQHRPWGSHDCQHTEDAGVTCQDAASDQIPPVITSCPVNQPTSGVIYALSGQTTSYNFPDATATDVNDLGQSTTPTISYTIQTANQQTSQQSSGRFPIGTTSVTVTATDDSVNQASCTFTVTVTESTASGPWEMLAQQCGRPSPGANTRIVNGNDVTDGRIWPWIASISNQYFCGAEIISENWAITAAHCIHGQTSTDSRRTTLTVGRLIRDENTENTHQTTVQIIEHENYSSTNNDNDIALLKLDNPVTFSEYVRPVCLATSSNEWAAYPESSAACHVIGWGALSSGGGSPDTLQEVASPLTSQADCRSLYSPSAIITENMICTSTASDTGSCQGDSGGPMMCKNSEGVWDLVGVTSWGYGCADSDYPDVLARVSSFQSWIRDNIDHNGGPWWPFGQKKAVLSN